MLACVIWKSFSFNFIKKKRNVPTFAEFRLYNEKMLKLKLLKSLMNSQLLGLIESM